MVNISKSENSIKFVFTDSDHYLYGNGEIEVPVNSLLLVIDESEMVTFKKLSGDPFLSFRADNSNLGTKAAIEQFYKDNMVGSTGGGSESGITPSEVQTMIDESISGKADTSDVTAVANDVSTLSGQVATKVAISDFNAYSAATNARIAEDEEVTAAALNDLQENKADTSAVTTVSDALTAHTSNTSVHVTSADKTAWNNKSDFSGDYNDLTNKPTIPTVPTNISDFTNDAGYITNADIAGKADTSAVTAVNDALTAHTANTTVHVTSVEKDVWNAKVDTSAITTAITSGSTDSEIPTAKATYDAIQAGGGGGATYSAGTNISIDTANTINCTLPIRVDDATKRAISLGSSSVASGYNSLAFGDTCQVSGVNSFSVGKQTNANGYTSVAFGIKTTTNNLAQASFGNNNITNGNSDYFVGNSGNTLFSVGNGNPDSVRHNAFEIRQNGDLYFADTDNTTYAHYYQKPMVRLQDMYGALGGLKLVKLTQAEYSAMEQAGTLDNSTLYIVTNVVS